MYEIIISPQAKNELRKLSKLYRQAVRIAINDLREDPYIGKPLTRNLKARYSYRIGVYRIIYKINDKESVVNVISAGHRSVVYN